MSFQFESMAAFWGMGGYGAFVWGAWGLSAAVIVALTARAMMAERHWRARLDRLEQQASDERD